MTTEQTITFDVDPSLADFLHKGLEAEGPNPDHPIDRFIMSVSREGGTVTMTVDEAEHLAISFGRANLMTEVLLGVSIKQMVEFPFVIAKALWPTYDADKRATLIASAREEVSDDEIATILTRDYGAAEDEVKELLSV